MTDKWHWLRHKWTKWETYHVHYKNDYIDLRQRRNCEVCGRLQDELVAEQALPEYLMAAVPQKPQPSQ